jgi:hypothetical protein
LHIYIIKSNLYCGQKGGVHTYSQHHRTPRATPQPYSDLISCTYITRLLKGPDLSTDPEVYRLRIMNTHSNKQTFGSTDFCFASTLADASQRTTPFNIHKVITPESTSSLFISIHRTSTVSLKPLITFLS